MVTDRSTVERCERHKLDLEDWRESDGMLLPTEPGPENRRLVRERLMVAFFILQWVIGEGQMSNERESGYMAGMRAVWAELLQCAANALGYEDPASKAAALIVERELAKSVLRRVCGKHGDNDWGDGLHLADVIAKHLEGYLEKDSAEDVPTADAVGMLKHMATRQRKMAAASYKAEVEWRDVDSQIAARLHVEAETWSRAVEMLEQEAEATK